MKGTLDGNPISPSRRAPTEGTPHAEHRLKERGAREDEVQAAVYSGERFQAKYGRVGFRRNFQFDDLWQGKHYKNKQIEAYAIEEHGDWLIITVIVKFF